MVRVKPKYNAGFARLLAPDYIAESVTDIDFSKFPDSIKAVAFDADSTIVEYGENVTSDAVLEYLKNVSLPIHIATNRLESAATEVARYTQASSVTFATSHYRKPQKSYFRKLVANAGLPQKAMVMVGDRLFTDIYGGNKSGLMTVYVKALGHDPWFIKYTGVRYVENVIVSLLTK